ncbi:tetratricopeptide repeat protein [Cupriavidus gilardii]|uniref:tetratricopeptide repeat protein n=1 Tax=Cupriavidus gilardii TaxID=82541 RepID=UPI0015809DB9|nr:tetratricopeptide repeat protein [Cupriavidus gilardii]MCT9071425.1 tetratricopeptide repeat protein [Cupriavidus gilardii]QKS61513.1 tetratricopeptide repeat protein [Cupriavidus gilardii]
MSAVGKDSFTLKDIEGKFGVSRGTVASLTRAGLLEPAKGSRGERQYSFQDVVLIRTADSLKKANVPPRRVTRALQRLKAWSQDRPLSGVRIAAVGNGVVVSEPHRQWEVETGQLVMELQPSRSQPGAVLSIQSARKAEDRADDRADVGTDAGSDAGTWFQLGCQLEAQDMRKAEQAYRRAIAIAPDYADPYLNLGCLLTEAGRVQEAESLYRDAVAAIGDEPLLHFNLGVTLEDLERYEDALRSYHRCIDIAPDMADAHFNAARLHEQLGDAHRAIRHFNQYRKYCR